MNHFADVKIDKHTHTKVYRGAYEYISDNSTYCEEQFEVYKHNKDFSYMFLSESIARVSTGELLKIKVKFVLSKENIPSEVCVTRELGRERSEELYMHDRRKNRLDYTFKSKRTLEKCEIITAPRFHISTPTMVSSMTFLLSKKFDATSKNYFSVISSYNLWDFAEEPITHSYCLERSGLGSETIRIGGKKIKAIEYLVYRDLERNPLDLIEKSEEELEDEAPPPELKAFISKYHTIPYMVDNQLGQVIKIKYLNNLDDSA